MDTLMNDEDLQALMDELDDDGEMDGEPEPRPLQIQQRQGETEGDALARTMLQPQVQAGVSLSLLAKGTFDEAGFGELVVALEDTTGAIKEGNLYRLEETLSAQATVLDAIFNHLVQRAVNNLGHYVDTVETYMKLALRAQSQCRATVDSLAQLKKPSTEVIRQTNIGYNQQINNRLGKTQSKLSSEEIDGERMDPETPQEAVRGDQEMETVGAKHRPKNAGRKD